MTDTAQQQKPSIAPYIGLMGKRVLYTIRTTYKGQMTMTIPVIIRDFRSVYNRIEVLIEPVEGTGSVWVWANSPDLNREE
jgi:hypothetical protein